MKGERLRKVIVLQEVTPAYFYIPSSYSIDDEAAKRVLETPGRGE
jgi:hypothetical protein